VLVGLSACVEYELPQDLDATSTGSTGGAQGDGDAVIHDGHGEGAMVVARARENWNDLHQLADDVLVIGAPDEAWEGTVGSGQLSVLIDGGSAGGVPGLVLSKPVNSPATIAEDHHSGADTFITQGMIQGDELSGDRFGRTLLPPRAVPREHP
jgi:hypothetical protein